LLRHRLFLRRGSRRLRHVLFQERLEHNEGDEGQKKDEKQPLLRAGFLLGILKVGQSLITVSNSWHARRATLFQGLLSSRRTLYRVITRPRKRMTAQHAAHGHPCAAQSAVTLHGFHGIFGAGRHEAAGRGEKRRDGPLVSPQ